MQQRMDSVHAIQQYAGRPLAHPMFDLIAGSRLDFFPQEIGPLVYGQASAGAQARMPCYATELDGKIFALPFPFWSKSGGRSR